MPISHFSIISINRRQSKALESTEVSLGKSEFDFLIFYQTLYRSAWFAKAKSSKCGKLELELHWIPNCIEYRIG